MKKLAYSIAILLAACSCTKEEVTDVNNSSAEAITFTATLESDIDSKALVGENNSVLWSKGDSISVLDVNTTPANSKFILESGEGTTTATFSGSCPSSSTGYFAVYPYNQAASLSGTNEVTVHWDGVDQKAVKSFSTTSEGVTLDTYSSQGSPMIAYGAAPEAGIQNVSLDFKNVCSYLKLTLATKVSGITIKANTDTDVIAAEDVTISWSDDTPTVTAVSNGSSEIHLTGSTGGSLEPGVYYIAILPGSLTSGITMTLISSVDSGESGIWTKTGSSQFTLARGKVYNLGGFAVPSWIKLAGSGTESDPYLIEDFTDLQLMETFVAYDLGNYGTAFYKQTADIDCTGKSLNPIGNAEHPFSGSYDGNDKTISNEKITNPVSYTGVSSIDRVACGLFGIIKDATIHDLTVQDPVFPAPATNKFSFSPFVGVAYSSKTGTDILTNCKCVTTSTINFTSTIDQGIVSKGYGLYYGGFIADSQSNVRITGCISQADLTITPKAYPMNLYLGGFIGYAQGVNTSSSGGLDADGKVIIDCSRNNSNLNAEILGYNSSNLILGGFIAAAEDWDTVNPDVVCQFTNCVNSGSITSTYNSTKGSGVGKAYAAGFVADMNSDGFGEFDPFFVNCINSGKISAYSPQFAYGAGFVCISYSSSTQLTICANCGAIVKTTNYDLFRNPFVVRELPTVINNSCWDTYTDPNQYSRYNDSDPTYWNYTSNKSEVVSTMNTTISDAGATTIYKSWKLNDDGNLDLDF